MISSRTHTQTISEIIKNPKECPIPVSIIPNKMGIKLSAVKSISWTKRSDGQLLDLTIKFIPTDEES